MSTFEIFIVGQFIVATLLILWFLPRTQVHLACLVRVVFRKKDNAFWMSKKEEMHNWLQHDLEVWKISRLPGWLSELTACPYCIGTHFSFWTAVFLVVFVDAPAYFFVIGTFGWTAVGTLILQLNQK
jgi:hypothetical protein